MKLCGLCAATRTMSAYVYTREKAPQKAGSKSFWKPNSLNSFRKIQTNEMATLLFFCNLKQVLVPVLLFIALFFFFTSFSIISSSSETQPHTNHHFFGRRILLEVDDDEDQPIKNKIGTTFPTKNKTKIIKASATKNQTKIIKPNLVSDLVKKNKTKLIMIKPTSYLTNEEKLAIKSHLKKMNTTLKSSKSAKNTTFPTKKSSDLSKISPPKNNTEKPMSQNQENGTSAKQVAMKLPSWVDSSDDDDLESGFTDLPSKFQETLVPDLERISKTSKVYLKKANKEITRGFKPFVGNNYAATIASLVTFTFILLPFILVSLIINKIKAYFSLQKILIFIQAYLSIYFSTLCLSSLASGLEPFRFLYAISQSTYVCLQIIQTLAYLLYLMLLLMYLILVFSTETGLPTKLLGLGQTFVGFVVGLHYYMMVFHRALLHEPPKTSWRVHAIYATCFFVLCVFTGADRRKKFYSDSDDVGKIS